jgi:eukaryotic-like serine/threonine-protein kinase
LLYVFLDLSELSPSLGSLAENTRFELLRHLGSGGMGAVYEAFDKQVGARVALKTLCTTSPEALLQLKNEFRAVQDLRHRHLVELFELFEADGHWFFTMALLDGQDFLSYVRPGAAELSLSGVSETILVSRERAPDSGLQRSAQVARPLRPEREAVTSRELDEARLRSAFAQLALGLCALHDAGKVHRDVKPSNVLVTAEGRVVLVDFGLAVESSGPGARGQMPPSAGGTRAFMAPEQAAGRPVTPAADSFSAGVMLYLALTGALPFHGTGMARERALGNVRPVLESNPNAPRDLSELCHALLQIEPAARPSARQMLARLGEGSQIVSAALRVPFVGRELELGQLLDAWRSSRERSVSVLISGDSGVGKSTLARRLLTTAQTSAPDALVLSGRCYERELVPYKAFGGVIDELSHHLRQLDAAKARALVTPDVAILSRIFPVLRRVPAFAQDLPRRFEHPAEQRSEAFAALRKLLFAMAEARPLLLFIDDLQWADADSLSLLGELLRVGAAPRMCFIATARNGPKAELGAIQTVLEHGSDVRQIALSPLTEPDAQSLAAELLGPHGGARLCQAIVREAAGHPLFLAVLAEYAKPDQELELGKLKLDDALWARIEGVDAPTRRVLELLAVAGTPVSDALLASAASLDPATCTASVRELRSAHLARSSGSGSRQIEPYHDRIRETVLARLPPSELCARHASWGAALNATGEAERDPQLLVRHLEGAGEPLRAAEQAKRAAIHSASVLAFDRAAELYRTALRLGSFGTEETQALTLELARSLTNAGRGPEAAEQYLKCVPGADPKQRLEYRRVAADQLLRSGHLAQGTSVLSDLLSEIGESFPRATRFTMASAMLHRLLIRARGLRYRLKNEAEIPADRLLRLDVYHTVSAALSLIDTRRASVFQSRSLLLALRTGEPKRLALALVMESVYVAAPGAEGLRRARALGAEAEALAQSSKDQAVPAACRLNQGFLEYHAGNFRLSAQRFQEGESLYRNTTLGTYHEQSVCRAYRMLTLRMSGQFDELWRGLVETTLDAQRRSDRFLEAGLNLNVNQAWLARGQPEEALRRIEQSSWVPTDGGYHFQQWYEMQARAELDLYCGRAATRLVAVRAALRIVRRTYIYTVRLHRIWAWQLLARLLVASTPTAQTPKRALAEAERLAERIAGHDVGYAQTYSALLLAAVAHQRGDASRVRRALEHAVRAAEAAALGQYATAARFRLGQHIGGAAGRVLLTEARAWMQGQDIREPEQMLELWAPGFS